MNRFTKKEIHLRTDENGNVYVASVQSIESEDIVVNEGE